MRVRAARRRLWGAAATVALVVALPVGCTTPSSKVSVTPGPLPYQTATLPVAQRLADLLARMTLREKAGQMALAERASVADRPQAVTDLGLGGVLSAGGSAPAQNTPQAWADMVDELQRAALRTRLHIPLLYGVDVVHGDNNLMGATVFPHNIGLGASRDVALTRAVYQVAAQETRATGPQWAFSPCLCVARDDRWGRTYESFGEDPALVVRMETAIDGLQGAVGHLHDPDRVLATVKHFAGDGDTAYGSGSDFPIDQGVSVTSRPDFSRLALAPYPPAVREHHVGAVMVSYSSVDWTEDGVGNPLKMHAATDLVTGSLKDQMRFDGIVVSDYNGIEQLPGPFPEQVRAAVNAGLDMVMEATDAQRFIDTLLAEVEAGRVARGRVDDAVSRILKAKLELGLFDHPLTDRRHLREVGSRAHHELARRAAASSQVLLRNRAGLLPIAPGTQVYVAGSNADSMGNQAGGWTLTWQGGSTTTIPGTTVLQGIRELAGAGRVVWSERATEPVPAQAVGVVVVGETPYAEGFGDVGGPRWSQDPGDQGRPRPAQTMALSAPDRSAIDTVCTHARACVVVVVSGRPLVIEPRQLGEIDALVAAWLPGSEGAGVADPIFGRTPYTARLPVTWPRSLAQEPINVGDRRYDPLFAYGWGLTTHAG